MDDTKLKISKTSQKSVDKWMKRLLNAAIIATSASVDEKSVQKHKSNKVKYRKQ